MEIGLTNHALAACVANTVIRSKPTHTFALLKLLEPKDYRLFAMDFLRMTCTPGNFWQLSRILSTKMTITNLCLYMYSVELSMTSQNYLNMYDPRLAVCDPPEEKPRVKRPIPFKNTANIPVLNYIEHALLAVDRNDEIMTIKWTLFLFVLSWKCTREFVNQTIGAENKSYTTPIVYFLGRIVRETGSRVNITVGGLEDPTLAVIMALSALRKSRNTKSTHCNNALINFGDDGISLKTVATEITLKNYIPNYEPVPDTTLIKPEYYEVAMILRNMIFMGWSQHTASPKIWGNQKSLELHTNFLNNTFFSSVNTITGKPQVYPEESRKTITMKTLSETEINILSQNPIHITQSRSHDGLVLIEQNPGKVYLGIYVSPPVWIIARQAAFQRAGASCVITGECASTLRGGRWVMEYDSFLSHDPNTWKTFVSNSWSKRRIMNAVANGLHVANTMDDMRSVFSDPIMVRTLALRWIMHCTRVDLMRNVVKHDGRWFTGELHRSYDVNIRSLVYVSFIDLFVDTEPIPGDVLVDLVDIVHEQKNEFKKVAIELYDLENEFLKIYEDSCAMTYFPADFQKRVQLLIKLSS